MPPRNIGKSNASVPENPVWIDFPRSDGERRYWPTNTTYSEDNGEINWMKLVDLDDDVALRWRLEVGKKISLDANPESHDHSRAILRSWPAEYRMYDHHKGKVGAPRHDIYLYGPQSKRFRSINEFVPHAIWLCRDETMNTKNCCCKYCAKLPQKIITGALDSIIHSSSVSAPPRTQGSGTAGPSTSTPVAGRDIYSALQKQGWARRDRIRDPASLAQKKAQREQRKRAKGKDKAEPALKVFASVQKQLKPMREMKPSDNVSDMPMLADRNRDLRAVYSRSANEKLGVLGCDYDDEAALPSEAVRLGVEPPPVQPNRDTPSLRRYYRENEIVWVQLPGHGIPVASLGSAEDMNISIWPGMVKASKIKKTPISLPQPDSSGSQGKPFSAASQTDVLNGHIQPTHAPSSAGLAGGASSSLASSHFRPASAPVRPQPSTAVPSALPGANQSTPSSTSSPQLRPVNGTSLHAASPAPTTSGTPIPSLPSRPTHAGNDATSSSSNSAPEPQHSTGWTVTESVVYTIQLSALDVRVEVSAAEVLPYLATAPADDFVTWLRHVHQYLNFEDDSIRSFDPTEAPHQLAQPGVSQGDVIQRASQAISAYALALQTASHICNDWSLTDKWDFEYVPPGYEKGAVRVNVVSKGGGVQSAPASSPPLPLPPSISAPMKINTHTFISGLSLATAIQDAGRSNAQGPTSFSSTKMNPNTTAGTGPVYSEISGTSDLMTEDDVRQVAVGVLGDDGLSQSSARESRVQVRFQGMWWGSERIWVDDFVRVKVPRGALAPNGAPNVYKPSGWGKKNKELAAKIQAFHQGSPEGGSVPPLELQEFQSVVSRGVFMKVGGIFVVDVPKPGGSKKKEGRVCGMLYELAELDWEETEPDLKEQYELEKQQNARYLLQTNGVTSPATTFKGSVDETLLPSTPKKSIALPPSLQSSPPPPYIMPQAPKGYRFRPILKDGFEAVLNLSLVAGRYYPRIIGHPLLAPKFTQELAMPRWDIREKQRTDLLASMSLEGLSAGHYNAVDPQYHKKSRSQMLEDAGHLALRDMAKFKEDIADAEMTDEDRIDAPLDDEMEEDERVDTVEEDELAMHVD